MKPETVQLARDLMRHTLHGPPPIATTMALAEAVIAGDADLAALRIEHEAQRAVIDGLRATGSMLIRERDELRAALLNERGEGEPPSEGWAYNSYDHTWRKGNWRIYRYASEGVRWIPLLDGWPQPRELTAREAMKAADAALAGSKS